MRDYFINDEYAEKKLVPMSQEIALDDRIRKMVLQKKNLKKLKKKIVDS
jgi:hypothetical protein